MEPSVFPHPEFHDYALIDSGSGSKLERFGAVRLERPDPQALWGPRLPRAEWERADWRFVRESDRGGRWEPGARSAAAAGGGRERARAPAAPKEWTLRFDGASLLLRATPFKHVGVFPEQAVNWRFVTRAAEALGAGRRPRLLNLFGYTGAASVLAARAGFEVTHVDASRSALAWTLDNLAASGLSSDALRLLLDDVPALVRREVRRGARYDGVLCDPPHYGRGPRAEKWSFERDLPPLLEHIGGLLEDRSFLVLTSYAIGTSPLAMQNLLTGLDGGRVSAGELALPEERRGEADSPRRLPAGFCARWTRGLDLADDP